ncbi:MAG TPA: arginine--tRNA ligase [Steroidobacteraceae bacterium]|nr:arginine--tRNA ligase [Steroidobacteraceae bacterium]
MKEQLVELIRRALAALPADTLPADVAQSAAESVEIERARDARHGDFATNVALRLAKAARRNPRELAQAIVQALPASELVARAEAAGAGFINLHLAPGAYAEELARVLEQGAAYGRSTAGKGQRVLVEFVSANPTGPLHVGHGRLAAYGSAVADLLDAAGYAVTREFYINDAGRQMDILTLSVWLRYLELAGESLAFPSNGYRGDYVRPVAEALLAADGAALRRPAAELFADLPPDAPAGDKDKHVDALIERMRALLGPAGFERVLEFSLERMLAAIRADLDEFGVRFENWYSERSLETSGAIERALERLKAQQRVYTKDGALWFRATEFGDDEDRVVVRENGVKTYFASDIAYHLDKRVRGYEHLIDVLGADHHGYVARVRAGLMAMGEPGECLEVRLIQLVSLFRGKEKLSMGKREGNFVTLRQLREEVGNDACRLFYLMRSNDQALDFDLELAKSRSNDNPVYYIQYAHARVASVMKQLKDRGLAFDAAQARRELARLTEEHEVAVLRNLTRYPEVLGLAALNRAPHALVHYLRELANDFHTYYNAHTFIVEDAALRNARLALVLGVQQVIRNGLGLLGVSAPEAM